MKGCYLFSQSAVAILKGGVLIFTICCGDNERILLIFTICCGDNERILLIFTICCGDNERILLVFTIRCSDNEGGVMIFTICCGDNERMLLIFTICCGDNERRGPYFHNLLWSQRQEGYLFSQSAVAIMEGGVLIFTTRDAPRRCSVLALP